MIEVRDLHYRYAESGPILRGIDYLQAAGESVAHHRIVQPVQVVEDDVARDRGCQLAAKMV